MVPHKATGRTDGMPTGLGLAQRMRLRSERDYRRVYRDGNRARGGVLLVVASANGLPETRMGLSVGRRVWKRAVRRNRIRRIFREAFRLEYANLPRGVDLILIPAEPRLRPRLEETRGELVRLAHKAHRRFLAKRGSEPRP